jgi:hypothetical protein
MPIASLDNWFASNKQQFTMFKSATTTTVFGVPFTVFDLAGQPGAGVLAGANTAAGVVPTDATAGFPLINAFGGAVGYLNNVIVSNTVSCRMYLFDMLFKAGAYAFNANVTLAGQPSYSSRIPAGGTDYTDTEIWIEAVTAFTGNQSIAITYTNQAGTAGRTTGTVVTGVAPTIRRMFRLPLQAGDTGVQKIDQVVSSVSTVGTFNVLVLRRLGVGRVGNNGLFSLDLAFNGSPQIFADSALYPVVVTDGTSSGIPELFGTIVDF